MARRPDGGESGALLNKNVTRPDCIAAYVNSKGELDEPVIAAGELRQGKAPSMIQMVLGTALIEILRPRRSKLLPRRFVLAVTETRVVAFKAWGGSEPDGANYGIAIRPGVRASFARDEVELRDLTAGSASIGFTVVIGGESFPVFRPNLNGDWDTDEVIALLAGLPPVVVPEPDPPRVAFSL
jgi:hypothetical protein